jgi:hypothetical protein
MCNRLQIKGAFFVVFIIARPVEVLVAADWDSTLLDMMVLTRVILL